MQKRFLSHSLGIKCVSERSLREEKKFLLSDHLTTKNIKAKERDDATYKSSKGFTDTEVPVVYIKDLSQYVKELLQKVSFKVQVSSYTENTCCSEA